MTFPHRPDGRGLVVTILMKAVVYDAPGQYTIREIPTPDPAPGEVRVRVQQTGICGTDLHIHNGKFFAEFRLTPATNWSGRSTRWARAPRASASASTSRSTRT